MRQYRQAAARRDQRPDHCLRTVPQPEYPAAVSSCGQGDREAARRRSRTQRSRQTARAADTPPSNPLRADRGRRPAGDVRTSQPLCWHARFTLETSDNGPATGTRDCRPRRSARDTRRRQAGHQCAPRHDRRMAPRRNGPAARADRPRFRPPDSAQRVSNLVVTRLAAPACIVAVIPRGPRQNEKARAAADAQQLNCMD